MRFFIDGKAGATPLITRASSVTALSNTSEGLWEQLLVGASAIRPVRRFPTDRWTATHAACIDGLDLAEEGAMVNDLLGCLFDGWGRLPADTRIVTATAKAGIDAFEAACRGGPPGDMQVLLPSYLPGLVGRKLGLKDQGVNISAACASSTIALARAAAMIASGRSEVVLVCCVDLMTEFIFSGFAALKALSDEPCRPFDQGRKGLTLGEGAAAVLLMSARRARSENRLGLARVCGWGISNDAAHITAPARDGAGLVRAVRAALAMAGIGPEAVAAISAHGTGTVYNDLMELVAFDQVFGSRALPVGSVKGAIGHALGAAGGIEVALAVKMLAEQRMPGTVGMHTPMAEAAGRVRPRPTAISGEYLLSTNSGFGGVNAALLLAGMGAA